MPKSDAGMFGPAEGNPGAEGKLGGPPNPGAEGNDGGPPGPLGMLNEDAPKLEP